MAVRWMDFRHVAMFNIIRTIFLTTGSMHSNLGWVTISLHRYKPVVHLTTLLWSPLQVEVSTQLQVRAAVYPHRTQLYIQKHHRLVTSTGHILATTFPVCHKCLTTIISVGNTMHRRWPGMHL